MPAADLVQFVTLVLGDQDAQWRLLAEPDRDRFAALVAELAGERGLAVTTAEVGDALRAARRSWLERWV